MKNTLFILILFIFSFPTYGGEKTGVFSHEHLCKAGIATNNGHSAKNIKTLSNKSGVISVAYTRDDGKIFGYSCKIEGKEIRWRDQSMSRWNKNIKLFYALSNNGKQLDISSVFFGEASNKSFTLNNF